MAVFGQLRNALGHWRLGGGSVQISTEVRVLAGEPEAIVFHIGTGRVFRANPAAVRIWRDLRSGKTPAEVVADLTSEYGQDEGIVRRDVAAFLVDLRKQHFLEVGGGF